MGEAADDAWDAADRELCEMQFRAALGIKRCRCFFSSSDDECPICHDLGWIDKDGKPSEGF